MALSYLRNGEALGFDASKCCGCGACVDVCPHAVFSIESGKARIVHRERCMECGACSMNCPAAALSVKRGVGCAAAIIAGKLRGTEPDCGGSACCGGGSMKAHSC